MSRHGVLQLSKLTVSYCEFSGSSRGARCVLQSLYASWDTLSLSPYEPLRLCREFVANLLPILQRECPDLEVLQKQQPGRHPLLKGDYSKYCTPSLVHCCRCGFFHSPLGPTNANSGLPCPQQSKNIYICMSSRKAWQKILLCHRMRQQQGGGCEEH